MTILYPWINSKETPPKYSCTASIMIDSDNVHRAEHSGRGEREQKEFVLSHIVSLYPFLKAEIKHSQ